MKLPANDRRIELWVFALALVLRLAWVGAIQLRGGELFGPDAASYDQLALSLLSGQGLAKWDYQGLFSDPGRAIIVRSFRPPLLPIMLAGIYAVAGHHYLAARVVMAVLGAAACVAAMRLARPIFPSTTRALAGIMMAVYPKLIYYSGEIVTETPYILLLLLALGALLAAQQPGASRGLLPAAGVLLGLATLCRSALLGFVPLACLAAALCGARRLRAIGNAALVAGGFALTMAPWWGRNAVVHGRFVPATTEGGYTFWVTNNARADGGGHCFFPDDKAAFDGLSEWEIDRQFYRMGLDWVRQNPGGFLRLSAAKFVRFWRLWPHASEPAVGLFAAIVAGATFTPVLLLALWGAWAARQRWRPLLPIALLFGYYTALHMTLMAITRYRLPLEPFLIILAAHGTVELWTRRTRPSQ